MSARDLVHYEALAALLDFPGPEFAAQAQATLAGWRQRGASAPAGGGSAVGGGGAETTAVVDALAPFVAALPTELTALQELHTRTFDVQSTTTLDIGYVLFGDDFKRARLLVQLAREHQRAGTALHGELADHLPNVLRLLPRLTDPDLTLDLVREILVPALLLMIREFDASRLARKDENYRKHYRTLIDAPDGTPPTLYVHALRAVLAALLLDFPVADALERLSAWSAPSASADFLGQVAKELEIETRANPMNSGCDA